MNKWRLTPRGEAVAEIGTLLLLIGGYWVAMWVLFPTR